MYTLLLIIIYMTFVSLGLPDALLGSAWPIMHTSFGVPESYAGIIATIISVGTVISSLFSSTLSKKFKISTIVIGSVFLTAVSLFAFSRSTSFLMVALFAVPYGLGAGAVDASINNFVANHYSSKHMNFLHAFWGVGASSGAFVMGSVLINGNPWNMGYELMTYIQLGLTAVLLFSIPLWKQFDNKVVENDEVREDINFSGIFKIKGVVYFFIALFCYCSMENTAGLWASTYLVNVKGVSKELAATFAAMFFVGITTGRMLSGFIANRFNDNKMVIIGLCLVFCGVIILFLPFFPTVTGTVGLITIGFGCAPIYPSLLHSTPSTYPKKYSQAIIGTGMASAYVGSTTAPLMFGFLASGLSNKILPIYVFIFASILFIMNYKMIKLNKNVK